MGKRLSLLACLFLTACMTAPAAKRPNLWGPNAPPCRASVPEFSDSDAIAALDAFSEYFEARCDQQALDLGHWIREGFRDKTYSVTTEVASVLLPEEVTSTYVLESYERAYLSIAMAAIYLRKGDRDKAAVELRRSYTEGKAIIYNFGQDAPNLMLSGAFWENLGEPETARPFWMKLAEASPAGHPAKLFAEERLRAIDAGEKPSGPWRIFALGRFPELDWSMKLMQEKSGYYEIVAKHPLPRSCRSQTGAVLGSDGWLEKIRARYASDYHPLLNAKSWVRLPIGVAYGVGTFAAGAGVLVGGCALDQKNSGGGVGCHYAAKLGVALMSESFNVVDYALKPDMRHWRRMPAAVLVTRADGPSGDECWSQLDRQTRLVAVDLQR